MLAGEMGLYDDPYDWYGRLSQDAFLTCRLVVDSGMNALGWSWEQAKQYMREHTMCAEGEIESDTLRYACGIPAQSLAYKLGDEEILRMRGDIQARLKDRSPHVELVVVEGAHHDNIWQDPYYRSRVEYFISH